MADRYALIGNPVEHSISPRIHALFARQTGGDIRYELILAPLDRFADTVASFVRDGGKGANVTLPFKSEACRLADEVSPQAAVAEAANTLVFRPGGEIYADNTDGVGLVGDLRRLGCAIEGRSLLIVGAGGAARGITPALLEACPRELVIANRTPERAQALAERFAQYGPIAAAVFTELGGRNFDGVINATSASLSGDVPDLPDAITDGLSWGYDLVYAKEPTPFMRWLADRGVSATYDGGGMLVAQAAESFYLWRGVKPDVERTLTELESFWI